MDGKANNANEEDSGSKRKVILGLDISTTCTAVTVLDYKTGEIISIYHTIMNNKKKFPDFWEKVKHMEVLFNINNNPDHEVVGIAVEESAKRFSPGFSSAGTIITLSKFNAILCYIMYDLYGLKPKELNVRTARKTLGIKIDTKDKSKTTKKKVLEAVKVLSPDFPLVYRKVKGEDREVKINEDRADSWVMARYLYETNII